MPKNAKMNEKEAALIQKLQREILPPHQFDRFKSCADAFMVSSTRDIQKSAIEIAALIEEQGLKKTCAPLRKVAASMKKLTPKQWNDAAALIMALEGACTAQLPKPKALANPFRNLD